MAAADPRLIVALDHADSGDARRLVERLGDRVSFYKIGLTLLSGEGLGLSDDLRAAGKQVFQDWKLHDIGAQVEGAARQISARGCELVTVHAEPQVMEAAVRGSSGGLKVLAVTVLTSLATHIEVLGADVATGVAWLLKPGSVAVNALVLAAMMRLATTQRPTFRSTLPGAVLVAVGWQLLQLLGGAYVGRVVSQASEINAVFAIVLGLMALLYVAAVIAVVGLEVNVVLARRLYPRALLTPFTDAVDLTDADRRAYADYAKAQRHKGFERVQVWFERPGPGDH